MGPTSVLGRAVGAGGVADRARRYARLSPITAVGPDGGGRLPLLSLPPSCPLTVLARTTSVDETRALAAALAELLRPGDVLLLSGEMGAGKTAFTQGLGAGLGFAGRITSPTFTIAHTYDGGRLRIHHLDVYRLEHLHEALDAGLAEMVDEGAVVVIEWGDAVLPLLPADHLDVRITFAPLSDDGGDVGGGGDGPSDAAADTGPPTDDERRWELVPVGGRWAARLPSLRTALASWEDPSC